VRRVSRVAEVLVGLVLFAALGPLAACRGRESAAAARAARAVATPVRPSAASPDAKRYPLAGVVTAVDASRSQITVAHDAIAGFMPAMTMPFPVRDDPRIVRLLRPGDRIEAVLVVDGGEAWLESVLTKGFVPSPAAGGSAVVTPEPNRGVAVGDPVPDFALTDQTGRTVRLSQFRGEPVAVTFIYTRCPVATACPLTVARFAKISAALAGEKSGELLAVTVDPVNDTPAVLRDYASRIGADPARWKFLTGDPKAVAKVAESFGVLYYPARGQIVHSQAVGVVDARGRLAAIFYGEDWKPEDILREMGKETRG
jgi:protein SCO1/2